MRRAMSAGLVPLVTWPAVFERAFSAATVIPCSACDAQHNRRRVSYRSPCHRNAVRLGTGNRAAEIRICGWMVLD
eukprot:290406-Pyramimonas_sp.AAC.1